MKNPTNRICLIEDDEIMGESLADRFVLDGYSCDWHRTARAAEDALLTREYFLVISDIRLPDLGGDELFILKTAVIRFRSHDLRGGREIEVGRYWRGHA